MWGLNKKSNWRQLFQKDIEKEEKDLHFLADDITQV